MKRYFNGIMLDIETMGVRTNAIVLEAAIAWFDSDGKLQHRKWTFDPRQQERRGRSIDLDTVLWWSTQANNAIFREACDRKPELPSIATAIDFAGELVNLYDSGKTELWANSPTFDYMIMQDLVAENFKTKELFPYKGLRDMRTLEHVANLLGYTPGYDYEQEVTALPGMPHTSDYDAQRQALACDNMLQFIAAHKTGALI